MQIALSKVTVTLVYSGTTYNHSVPIYRLAWLQHTYNNVIIGTPTIPCQSRMFWLFCKWTNNCALQVKF